LDSTGLNNLQFILNYFTPEKKDTTVTQPWSFYADDIRLFDSHFKLNAGYPDTLGFGVDFNNLDVTDVNVLLEKVEILSDTLYAFIDHIDFKEKSGFDLDTLQGNFVMSAQGLSLDKLSL